MAFYGRPSLPFASPKTLQTPKTPQRPLPWLLMGFQRRQKLPQGQIHCCFWAVQRAVRQAFAANGHPKATSMASSGLPAPFARPKTLQTPKTPNRPLQWLLMGFQRRQKPTSMAFYGRPSLPFARPKTLQTPKTPKRPLQWLLMGFQRRQKPTSMAFYGRPSLPFARPKTLQTPKTPKRPLQWLLMGFQRRQKPTSMAFYGRPSLPFARPKTLQTPKPLKPLKGHFNGFLWASSAGKSPHPWLFMGVQACRLPGLKPSKPLKPLKGHFNGFLWASSAGKSPHPWLFMGVQACRLPGLKPSKPLKPSKLQWP